MKRAFGKTPAVAAALILTLIPALAGCRGDGEPGLDEAAASDAVGLGAEHAPDEPAVCEAAPAFPAWARPMEITARLSPAWVSARADDRAPAIVPRDSWEQQGDLDWAFLADGGWRAIAADGSLWAWGRNWFGGIGDGTRNHHDAPVRSGVSVGNAYDWAYVTTGGYATVDGGGTFTFGIRTDGSLWAWGINDSAELGIGGTTHALRPVRVLPDSTWASVSAGSRRRSVAIRADGTLWEWGQLYDIVTFRVFHSSRPRQVGEDSDWVSATAGSGHSVAIKADGSLWAWGTNRGNRVAEYGPGSNAPVHIGSDYGWAGARVWASDRHSVAIREDGTLWAWGSKVHHGQGYTESIMRYGHLPVQIGESSDWASALARNSFTVAAKTDGSLWAWGWNWEGNPDPVTVIDWRSEGDFSAEPVRIDAELGDWLEPRVSVSAGSYHSVAIRADGSLWAWGSNSRGQLGDGHDGDRLRVVRPMGERNVPTRIGDGNRWASASAGGHHTAAIKIDGSLWTWGGDTWGQLGRNGQNHSEFLARTAPGRVGAAYDWAFVSAGHSHNVAIRIDGSLWSWGWDGSGRDGVTGRVVRIGEDNDWVYASAGGGEILTAVDTAGAAHTAAIRADGSLWVWGCNRWGQIGTSSEARTYATPTRIGTETDWVYVSAGAAHTVAIRADGSLWAWGWNLFGQVGDGTEGEAFAVIGTPTRIGTGTDWASASAGNLRTFAVKSDGSLWGWGMNALSHQTFDQTRTIQNVPVRIGEATNLASAAAGNAFIGTQGFAMGNDGSLWAWGTKVDINNNWPRVVIVDYGIVPVRIIPGGDG